MPTSNPSTAYTDAFELLASERRREALRVLRDAEGPVPVDELAAILACGDRDQRDSNVRRRIEAELQHRHVPKLAEHGVVASESGMLEYRPDELVETLLEVTADEQVAALR